MNDQSQNIQKKIPAEYDLEVRVLGTDNTISNVSNFKIDQLRVLENSISPETILSLPESVQSSLKFEGLSLIRITDSNLQLQKIKGVSIVLRSNRPSDEKSTWIFQDASV